MDPTSTFCLLFGLTLQNQIEYKTNSNAIKTTIYIIQKILKNIKKKRLSIDKHINYQNTCKKMYKWGPHSVTLSNNKSHKNLDLEWKNGPEKEIKSGNGSKL